MLRLYKGVHTILGKGAEGNSESFAMANAPVSIVAPATDAEQHIDKGSCEVLTVVHTQKRLLVAKHSQVHGQQRTPHAVPEQTLARTACAQQKHPTVQDHCHF